MKERWRIGRLLAPLRSTRPEDEDRRGPAARGRRRWIALLVLFDALLLAAVLLSLQSAELIEQERTLVETRTYYEFLYRDQVITHTEIITQVLPYGSVP